MERRENSHGAPMYLFEDTGMFCHLPDGHIGHPRGSLQGPSEDGFRPGHLLFTLNGESIYFNQEQVQEFLPLLQAFVDTGSLP